MFNVSSTPQVLIDHQISEEDGQLFCNWDVLEAMFPPGTIEAMVAAYAGLLPALAAGTAWDRRVADALPAQPRAPFLPGPAPDLLHAGFERQARATPDRLAVIAPEGTLTYAALDAAATHLAATLLPRLGGADAARDRLVAVGQPKGLRQIVAVLAILKAGAAYLPVDPALPAERRRLLIERGEALPPDDDATIDAALNAGHAPRAAGPGRPLAAGLCDLHLGLHRHAERRDDRASGRRHHRRRGQPALAARRGGPRARPVLAEFRPVGVRHVRPARHRRRAGPAAALRPA